VVKFCKVIFGYFRIKLSSKNISRIEYIIYAERKNEKNKESMAVDGSKIR